MKRRILIIIIFVLVIASAIISAMFYSNPKSSGWSIELIKDWNIGTYKGAMSEKDRKTILDIWNKYEQTKGSVIVGPDACFRISDDENHTEFFAYNEKDGLIQYCLADYQDYHDRYKNINTFAYLSEEDQAVVRAMIKKYRSKLVKWTLKAGHSKYELTSESIEAFAALWDDVYMGVKTKSFEEKQQKDPDALFTITLHNCGEGESYFIFKDKTLKFVIIEHFPIGEYREYHRWVILKPESLATMWKIIEYYTG